jgi:hypothetical protein
MIVAVGRIDSRQRSKPGGWRREAAPFTRARRRRRTPNGLSEGKGTLPAGLVPVLDRSDTKRFWKQAPRSFVMMGSGVVGHRGSSSVYARAGLGEGVDRVVGLNCNQSDLFNFL